MSIHHANFAETTLGAAITTTDGTSITVTSSASFPAVDFIISIDSECFLVTNVSTTTWTVTRGYEGSTAATHLNGAAVYHDWSAGEADAIAGKLDKAGGTMSGDINMGNKDISYLKLLKLNGEIDDGNSGTAKTLDWNKGTVHKSTLTGNVTFAFTGNGNNIIPAMTSDTAPSGVASVTPAGGSAYKAFDGNDTTMPIASPFGSASGKYLQYQFPAAHTIIQYAIYTRNYHLIAWKLSGSNNGTDWTDIDTRTDNSTAYNSWSYWTVNTPGSYTYYRLTLTTTENNYYLWGDLSLIETATTDPSSPCFLTLKLVQDGTGGRTVTWPATVKGSPVINQAAGSTSNILFYWDGTNYYTLNGLPWVAAPAAANSAGFAGQMAWDTSYFYVCTAASTWKRVAIATW